MTIKVKQHIHNTVAVYFSNYFNCWMMESNDGVDTCGTYKQAQIEARKKLWQQQQGSIFYSRKSDALITMEEYIDKGKNGLPQIKGQRMNVSKAA